LLSRDAEVDTKPQLEIYADDVKCAHGATVGQLDRDAIYYLRSRGVDEETARSVLTYAFANDILGRIEIPSVRSYVESMLAARLLHGQRIEGLI
jgi:Fe-S cluster assembly protein SufD